MPDRRRHRGAHPSDPRLFGPEALPTLARAVDDLAWLLGRGYSDNAAVKLVGDRHGLTVRQRMAMRRAACPAERAAERRSRRVAIGPHALNGRTLLVDGFNCLITIESALSGGLLLRGRDGALRDLASIHGSYRTVEETVAAARAAGEVVAASGARRVRWLLDAPISNSGRLSALLRDEAAGHGWPWEVEVVMSPDRLLIGADEGAVVATSDSGVLDRSAAWVDLPAAVIAEAEIDAWVIDLS